MNIRKAFSILIMCCVSVPLAFGQETALSVRDVDGLTLKDCYEKAIKHSETIAIHKELIKETEGQMLQALSTALPKVAFAYSQKWEDLGNRSSIDKYTPEAKFTLSQPLFTGFKEFAAVGASRHVGKQREAELKRARELLFMDVSDAFYLFLNYQENLDVLENTRQVLHNRVAELEKREALGKSRRSEVANAESRLRRIEANIETVKGQKDISGQLLEFLIGEPVERLVEEELPSWELVLSDLAAKADQRADVVAAREERDSYKRNITASRSGFFPSVTLTGNAYTKRSDTYEGDDWDATLTVNVPLFNGTTDFGALQQARAQASAADLRLSLAKRRALLEIRNAWSRREAARRSLSAFEKALDASEKNYMLQVEDFQRNLVSNLDVLQALEDLQTGRSSWVSARIEAARTYWNLRVATGEILP